MRADDRGPQGERTRALGQACLFGAGIGHQPSRSGLAGRETTADVFLRQVAADEDDAALARFLRLPRPLMIAVEDHVDPLEHEALRIVLERQDALAAQDVRALLRSEEHTSELQSHVNLVCRLLLEK